MRFFSKSLGVSGLFQPENLRVVNKRKPGRQAHGSPALGGLSVRVTLSPAWAWVSAHSDLLPGRIWHLPSKLRSLRPASTSPLLLPSSFYVGSGGLGQPRLRKSGHRG